MLGKSMMFARVLRQPFVFRQLSSNFFFDDNQSDSFDLGNSFTPMQDERLQLDRNANGQLVYNPEKVDEYITFIHKYLSEQKQNIPYDEQQHRLPKQQGLLSMFYQNNEMLLREKPYFCSLIYQVMSHQRKLRNSNLQLIEDGYEQFILPTSNSRNMLRFLQAHEAMNRSNSNLVQAIMSKLRHEPEFQIYRFLISIIRTLSNIQQVDPESLDFLLSLYRNTYDEQTRSGSI